MSSAFPLQPRILFLSSGKTNKHPGPIIQAQAESLKEKGIIVEHFTINEKGLKGYLKESLRLRNHLKQNVYNIIHAHYGLTAIVALIARRKEKLVVSFMGDDLVGSRKPDGNNTRISLMLANFNAWLSRWFYDFSIVKSAQMANRLKTKRYALIPNGVNVQTFQPGDKKQARTKLNIPESGKLIIFVSLPTRAEKNFRLAEQSVPLLNDENTILLPLHGISQSELVDYYNAADVMVLSSYHEGSPNVIKEAMACNCPIVATDVGDVRWVLEDTEGCYIAGFEMEGFAEKLRLALDYAEKEGRTKGRERILKLGLDSDTIAQKIVDVYERVLK